MIINLRKIFEVEGAKKDLHYSISQAELEDIHGYEFNSPVRVDGVIQNHAGIVTLQFQWSLRLGLCDRCIKILQGLLYEFEHIIVKLIFQ